LAIGHEFLEASKAWHFLLASCQLYIYIYFFNFLKKILEASEAWHFFLASCQFYKNKIKICQQFCEFEKEEPHNWFWRTGLDKQLYSNS
jgi:hypothetical protein